MLGQGRLGSSSDTAASSRKQRVDVEHAELRFPWASHWAVTDKVPILCQLRSSCYCCRRQSTSFWYRVRCPCHYRKDIKIRYVLEHLVTRFMRTLSIYEEIWAFVNCSCWMKVQLFYDTNLAVFYYVLIRCTACF